MFIIFLSIALSGCTQKKTDPSHQVVLKVNDQELNLKRFSLLLARRLKNVPAFIAKDPIYIDRIKGEVIAQFISFGLIQEWSLQNQITISNPQLEKEIEKIRKDYPDDLSFRKFLAQEGLSFSDWRSDLKNGLLEQAFFNQLRSGLIAPTAKEIQQFYESNKSKYKTKERILLRQIVVSDQIKAESLLRDAQKGDFVMLAKRYSIAPEAKNGGLLGWIEAGSLTEFDALFKAQPMKIQIIKTPAGYHLVRIEKKMPAGFLSPSEVQALISEDLMAQKEQAAFLAWTDRQLRNSHVFKNTDLINAIKVETRGEKNESVILDR